MSRKLESVLGWAGGILLALCAVPETYIALTTGTVGIGWGMLLMWYVGEIFILISILRLHIGFLLLNYIINIICITLLIAIKIGG